MSVQLFLLVTMLLSSVVGFVSVSTLLKMMRLTKDDPALRVTYFIGSAYFIGLGLLTANRLAGPHSPLPFTLVEGDQVTYLQAVAVWVHFCIAAIACARAWLVHRVPTKTPEGRAYIAAQSRYALSH